MKLSSQCKNIWSFASFFSRPRIYKSKNCTFGSTGRRHLKIPPPPTIYKRISKCQKKLLEAYVRNQLLLTPLRSVVTQKASWKIRVEKNLKNPLYDEQGVTEEPSKLVVILIAAEKWFFHFLYEKITTEKNKFIFGRKKIDDER